MPIDLRSDPQKAVKFLNWLTQYAPIYLEQMSSRGKANPKHKSYGAGETASAVSFVSGNNNDIYQRNLYFLPNAEYLEGKRNKANLKAVGYLHVDLDNKDYPGDENQQEERIINLLMEEGIRPKGIPHPSAIWFTGGGFQAVWKLKEPISVDAAEALNKSLLVALQGGPGTHDANRLLRLPWTTNWLNDKKRDSGRVPKVAHPIHPINFESPPVSFNVDDFHMRRADPEPKLLQATGGTTNVPLDFEALPLPDDLSSIIPLDQKWVEVLMTGQIPPDKAYNSRSELVFAATLWMLGKGMEPGHVLSIITDSDFGISAHVLDNPNPLKYGHRQIKRAYELLETKQSGWPAVDDNGRPIPRVPENIRYAFTLLGIDVQRNEFTETNEISGYKLDNRDLNEVGDILWSVFSREFNFSANPEVIRREIAAVAHENTYHPVKDYLEGVSWDGVPRIDTWLETYCGAEDTELNREFGSKFLVAAVRRIKQPGVKFDTMLVLEGAQGAGKSQLAAMLAVRSEWYCGSLDLRSDDKTKAELLSRAWIVECQELDGMNKTTSQGLKKFLSTSVDLFRPAYGRTVLSFKRHCVIIGTTNEDTYLRDRTGNRRIWPVRVGEIDLEGLSEAVNQLWAEAVVREREGGSIVLSKHLWGEASRVQDLRMVEDEFAEVLTDNFANRTGRVSMDSIKLLLNLDTSRTTKDNAHRIKAAMDRLGWEYGTHRLHDLSGGDRRPKKGFARGSINERATELFATQKHGVVVVVEDRVTQPDTPF